MTYEYEFSDGTRVEVEQSIHDDALTEIDGQPVRRVLLPPAIAFKGPGFHNNDYPGNRSASRRAAGRTSSN